MTRNLSFLCLAGAVAAALAAGCGGNGWKKTYPAKGTLLFEGKPATGAEVTLIPLKGELKDTNPPVRPSAKVDGDGNFALMTYVTGDGAPEGEYVLVAYWEEKVKARAKTAAHGDDDEEPEGATRNRLPARYLDPARSGMNVTIKPGTNTIETFDLKR